MPPPTVTYPPPRATPFPTYTPGPQPVRAMPGRGHILYTTRMNEIYNFDGDGMHSTGLVGTDAVQSPDNDRLAYVRDGRLYVYSYQSNKEQGIDASGKVRMPAWNADGTALAFIAHEDARNLDTVYQLQVPSMKLWRVLMSQSGIVAPPISNPATNRLLIAEARGTASTEFYTIDPVCGTGNDCKESLATVPYAVRWAVYQPNGTAIVFVEESRGDLYALKTGSKEVSQLVNDGVYKQRVAFDDSGSRLAYIDQYYNLYILDLTEQSVAWLMPTNVASVDWAGN